MIEENNIQDEPRVFYSKKHGCFIAYHDKYQNTVAHGETEDDAIEKLEKYIANMEQYLKNYNAVVKTDRFELRHWTSKPNCEIPEQLWLIMTPRGLPKVAIAMADRKTVDDLINLLTHERDKVFPSPPVGEIKADYLDNAKDCLPGLGHGPKGMLR